MSSSTAQSSKSQGWRFLLSRRWLGYIALLVVFAIACGFLSSWQFDRRDQRVDQNNLVATNFDAEPQPVDEVLPELDSFAADQEWFPVLLEGEYLVEEELLVRARPRDGMPGFEILTPFLTDDGTVFVVNRGWIATGEEQDLPDHRPAAPEGPTTVSARLKPGEPEIPGRGAPEGQIATIHLESFAAALGEDRTYTGAYGLLRSESANAETGALVPKPEPTEGNHLSYAFQWIIFAIIALVGLIYGLREEFRERNEDDPRVVKSRERDRLRAARAKKTDADYEDELIDSQG
ncbi:MAG: SURF1 family cytochrome oxidase biogenesis protein [Gulosibacter sp.]|uniref:SURF1 family cytochrome oxidase biogenesis protein n=1 Tax=Gulosibacter sp. TaxID=2817531 RepID=UPI003F8E43D9